MKLVFLLATIGFLSTVNGDCWWTGCQLHTWAVVGCGHYGRTEAGKQDCQGGYMYNCCTGGGGGGRGGGGGGGGGGRVSGGGGRVGGGGGGGGRGGGSNSNNIQSNGMDSVGKYAYCWWTGCQLDTWAVVGCDHYPVNKVTVNTQRCAGGNRYHCCPQ